MTKEVTKSRILQEMQDKFGMREFAPAPFLFDETVVPVYNIEQHLQKYKCEYKSVSITSGPDGYEFFQVPENERWILDIYNVVFMAIGAYKVSGLYVERKDVADDMIYLDLAKNQTASYAKVLTIPFVLDAGDTLNIYVDDYTSTAALRVYIDYLVEEIR